MGMLWDFAPLVLQGGEDPWFHDGRMTAITAAIRQEFPDCAITLSLGERSRESYQRLFDAGADRYLLRHETASPEHYHLLHPDSMSFSNRMECSGKISAPSDIRPDADLWWDHRDRLWII